MPADPQLQAWIDDARRAADRVGALAELSTSQLSWRPAPGTWSICEVVEHLTTTDRLASRHWEEASARGWAERRIGHGPFALGWLGSWWLRQVGPNPHRTVSTPAIFAPSRTAEPAQVFAEFIEQHRRFVAWLESLDGLHLARIKARSAVTPLLRLNLASWIAGAIAHQHRHLEQIARLRHHADFPKA